MVPGTTSRRASERFDGKGHEPELTVGVAPVPESLEVVLTLAPQLRSGQCRQFHLRTASIDCTAELRVDEVGRGEVVEVDHDRSILRHHRQRVERAVVDAPVENHDVGLAHHGQAQQLPRVACRVAGNRRRAIV